MNRNYAIIQQSAQHLARATEEAVGALRQGRVEQEPAFTDRMIGYIEHAMSGFILKGIRWTAKTLTDHGPNTQEKEYGADFAGVLDIDLPNFAISKGFLAQAKLLHAGEYMQEKAFRDLQGQCEKMLDHSPASFVFIYAPDGIFVVPALSVVSSDPCDPRDLYHRSISSFYQEHFASFIGDRQINSPTPEMLQQLRERLNARRALYLRAEIAG